MRKNYQLNNPLRLKENECIFYYEQQSDNQIYQIICEIIFPPLINKNYHNIIIKQDTQLAFTFYQKENLRSQYLSNYLLN